MEWNSKTHWFRRLELTYGGVEFYDIGLGDLITNKEAADRPQDRADVAYLRKANDF